MSSFYSNRFDGWVAFYGVEIIVTMFDKTFYRLLDPGPLSAGTNARVMGR
jgi:hypothetical protein